ncbi:xylose-binding protein [Halanaerobium congolense]|jgi:D-xylose transport system substrate-binding protein|uniref:Xylose-binding protein n=1 Tax=Halanaerobium congolense TaxID=54121 RepID=A0A1H9Y7L2_9FIRM|nr:substrate-binding domain-containing protein [Halanaerobium congolense]PTX16697.1 xylose-binding protein [Halanaerobium congolense]SDE83039.1 xylose-binding protein [Halanaerobium congolense]SES64399.1 xylose-binding protein [Halanaerobium congolense]SFO90998.1 xylose-binding protein [Halanaerobium congolense]
MKKLSILLVVILLVSSISMAAFAQDDGGWLSNLLGNNDGAREDDGEIKVGFLLKTMQEERYIKDRDAFIEKAEEEGADEVIFDSANNDENEQLSKFENMLTQGADVIVLQPVNTGTASNMVRMAHESGVAVINYDSLIMNSDVDVFLTQDSWAVGELQGEAMVEWFKENRGEVKGNVVLLRGQPGDSNANAFSQGVLDTVAEYEGLNLVVDQSHEGWSPNLAMETTENALTSYDNEIDAVVANNSGLASGAVRALEAQNMADTDKVFVAGSDADLLNIRYIAQGKQSVEIFKKVKPLAYAAAETAVALAKNPDRAIDEIIEIDRYVDNGQIEVPTVVTEIVVVNEDNIMDTVVADGYHEAEEIFDQE